MTVIKIKNQSCISDSYRLSIITCFDDCMPANYLSHTHAQQRNKQKRNYSSTMMFQSARTCDLDDTKISNIQYLEIENAKLDQPHANYGMGRDSTEVGRGKFVPVGREIFPCRREKVFFGFRSLISMKQFSL